MQQKISFCKSTNTTNHDFSITLEKIKPIIVHSTEQTWPFYVITYKLEMSFLFFAEVNIAIKKYSTIPIPLIIALMVSSLRGPWMTS